MSDATDPVQWLTLQVVSANLLNLALPGHAFYPGQDPYSEAEYERKLFWLGAMVARMGPTSSAFRRCGTKPRSRPR